MDYMRYHRYIILLDGENREFALREEGCKGHLKIETGNNKGALRCRVENLKPMQRNEYVYKLIFFGKKRERTIYAVIGSLNTGRNGVGETYFRFNPTDVDGQGHSFDDFSSIIVAAASLTNDKEPLHPVLSGETGNQAAEEDGAPQGEPPVFFHEEDENSGYGFGAPAAEPYMERQPGAEAPEVDFGAAKGDEWETAYWNRPAKEGRKTYNYFYNRQLKRSCEHMCQIVGYYEELQPFEEDHLHAKWRKVQNVRSIPILSPGAGYFAGRYKHYLFGAKEGADGRAAQYYIAIPGRFIEQEQPDNGESGFTYWQAIKGSRKETGAYGYWITAIDPVTGDIMDAGEDK